VGGVDHRVTCLHTSPNDSFATFADVGLYANLSDSKWLGAFALNPSIIFAFETKGEALAADGKKGIYMGIGLAPGYTFFEDAKFPVNISLPMTFGFSLKDYYTVNGENQTFGYFSGGPLITMRSSSSPPPSGAGRSRPGCSSWPSTRTSRPSIPTVASRPSGASACR
jgi:hypothetical protein